MSNFWGAVHSEALRAQNRLLGYGINGWDTGALRNYLAEGTANDAEVTTCIPDYISVCGLDLQSYQIYARCILLQYENRIPESVSRGIRHT